MKTKNWLKRLSMGSPRLDLSVDERRRRKRERLLIAMLIPVVAFVAVLINRHIYFSTDFPVSNQISIFILININLLLLLLLIFLVFRNLVKLLYDRKRKVMGARLRTRLVVAFIALTLLPSTVLFVFSINFITSSIQFWFKIPVEQALEKSLDVGRFMYLRAETDGRHVIERLAAQIQKENLLGPGRGEALSRYIQAVQHEFNLQALEVYDAKAIRICHTSAFQLEEKTLPPLSSGELRDQDRAGEVHTVSSTLPEGELLRVVGRVPFGSGGSVGPAAFLVISQVLPPELSDNIASITRGFEEYQQIKLLKRPILIFYYLTLSVVALLVVFCAVWLGFYLAKTITIPIMQLADSAHRVAEGDLSFALDIQADDEIGSLVAAFNKMTADLRTGREQLELSAQMLRHQNIEIEERRRYMEIVLKSVSTGVITIDARGNVRTFNPAAEKMLGCRADEVLNKSYRDLLKKLNLRSAEEILNQLPGTNQKSVEIPMRLNIDGRPRSFLAYINTLKDEAGQNIGVVMVVDDLTELEKAQRMAAWREVARRIAHEVKNPLTPITLSAQRLKRRYSQRIDEPVFDECTQMIINHVELIRNLVNEFSAFARFPSADPKPCALAPIVEETVALYREGHPGIHFNIVIEDDIPVMSLDRQQIKQAMINLVDNAVSAVRSHGEISVTLSHDPILKSVRIEVADDGMGVSDEDKIRLFEPNFSTKKTGMGLGLTIVNSIIMDHNGLISVKDNQPHGARFVIELPV